MPIPNKNRGKTLNKDPSLTDQSGAKDTDLNIIVKKFVQTGTMPGQKEKPLYGDFSNLPTDLRGFIQQARSIEKLRGELPKALADLTVEDLVVMDDQALVEYLKPKEVSKPETKETKE